MSRREIRYEPIRGPEKSVSWTQMQAILAKHKPPEVEVMPSGPNESLLPSVAAGVASAENTLSWHPRVKGQCYILSTCGRFSIEGSRSNGKLRYTAWRISSPIGEWRTLLGCRDTPQEAKALCT